jgi:hypothetical protein
MSWVNSLEAMEEEIMPKKLLLILLVGILLGCTTTAGRKFDTTAVDRIDLGQTTEGEVITMLGMPESNQKLSNGSYVFVYNYGHRLPLGMGTTVDLLRVQFYDGVVIDKWQRMDQY